MLVARLLSLVVVTVAVHAAGFTRSEREVLRSKALSLFNHAWDSYMDHGFPYDEVRPLSCTPVKPDHDIDNTAVNDSCGNFTSTLIDNLDTFALLGDTARFAKYVQVVREMYWDSGMLFHIDANVQVFETDIRILGGLLSAHLYAEELLDGYDGFLLQLSLDLGERLILAYDTPSRFPVPRTNLAKTHSAIHKRALSLACTSGVSTPVLELTLLSRLSGNPKFEMWSVNSFGMVWGMRSARDLVPMTIDPYAGTWLDRVSGIGASIDSFFEYSLKFSVLFDDPQFKNVWDTSYRAMMRNSGQYMLYNVDYQKGDIVTPWIDSLSAFFPGLQVLAGDVSSARYMHNLFYKVWNTYGGLPERWNFHSEKRDLDGSIALEWWPLRPEFIESTYHLYRATKDPVYLQIGANFIQRLETLFKFECGFAGYQDTRSGEIQDRMESFVIGETLKYLYLLFDDENPVHTKDTNIVFSTEAHPLWYKERTEYDAGQVKRVLDEMLKDDYWFSKRLPHLYVDQHMFSFVQERLPRYLPYIQNVSSTIVAAPKTHVAVALADAYHQQWCEVPKLEHEWLVSELATSPQFDLPADIYRNTLVKPAHLASLSFEMEPEQEPGFREVFVDWKQPVCSVSSHNLAEIRFDSEPGQLYSVHGSTGPMRVGDLFVMDPQRSDMLVDRGNTTLPHERHIDCFISSQTDTQTLRVLRVDGKWIHSGQMVWVDPDYTDEYNFFQFDPTGCAFIYTDTVVVFDNLRKPT